MLSKDNKLIKLALKLKRKKYREEENLFLAEGIRFVESAMENSAVNYILYSEKIYSTNGHERILNDSIDSYIVDEQVIKDICDTENPQGVVAVCKKVDYVIDDILKDLIVILDEVQDPGNLGTIIRTCDAAGVDGIVILKGTVDVYNPKVLRSTMGSIFNIPIVFVDKLSDISNAFLEGGYNILASSLEGSKPLYEYDFSAKTAVILGNEANGVKEENMNMATHRILVPMEGQAESLNVGIANSVIVYEALRQRLYK